MRGSQSELISALEVNSVSVPRSGAQGARAAGVGLASLGTPPPHIYSPKTIEGPSVQRLSPPSAMEETVLDPVQN